VEALQPVMDVLQPVLLFILIVFLLTEGIKQFLWRVGKVKPDRWVLVIAVVLGLIFAVGWQITVLPEAPSIYAYWIGVVLTGLLIAFVASGVVYPGLRKLIPWFDAFNAKD